MPAFMVHDTRGRAGQGRAGQGRITSGNWPTSAATWRISSNYE